MPRQPRLDAPGTLHHVMGLGIETSKIQGYFAGKRREAVRRYKAFVAAVARFLGVTTSAVVRAARAE